MELPNLEQMNGVRQTDRQTDTSMWKVHYRFMFIELLAMKIWAVNDFCFFLFHSNDLVFDDHRAFGENFMIWCGIQKVIY